MRWLSAPGRLEAARRWRPAVRTAGLAAVLLGVAGCEEDPAAAVDRCIEESIAQGRQANWTQGVWRITGDGERSGCTDESLDADSMSITSRPIRVHQQGHFLFLEDAAHYPGFALSGMVGDRCIHVRTSEQTPYGVVRYDLPAFFLTSSSFGGEFTGSGPETCHAEGTFDVFANLDAIPASPIANPAPPDAGTSQASLCEACMESCQLVEAAYIAVCESGCDHYVCDPMGIPDAAGPEGGPSDAADEGVDAPDDSTADASDAPDDTDDDGADDAAADDAGDAGEEDAPDSSDDANVEEAGEDAADGEADAEDADDAADAADADDEAPDSGADGADAGPDELQYTLWDGSVSAGGGGDGDTGSVCSLPGPAVPGRGTGFGSLLLALGAGFSLRLRRRP